MKIKSLLAAVSMVALTAGSASALTIPVNVPATGTTPAVMPANALAPEGVVLANELSLPADGIGDLTFSIATESGNYPSGNNFIVNLTLPGGVEIDGPISGSVLESVSLDGAVVPGGSAVVQNQSGSTIQLFVSIPQQDVINELNFSIPLSLASCNISGGLTATVATESGTSVEDGVATAASPITGCASAFDTDFAADADDTVIALSDYEQLRNTPGGTIVTTSIIGLYDALIDTDVAVDLMGTTLTAASVDEVTFDIVLEDGSEVTGISVNNVAGTASDDGNTYSFALSHAGDITDAAVEITVDGGDTIVGQSVTVTNVLHDFTDAGGPDLIGSEAGAGGALDALQREGQAFGVFDWNSGQAGAQRLNVYRITGLDADSTVPYTVSIENAGLTGAANTVTGSVTANGAGEAVLTDSMIAAMLPADVARFDFGINLETGNDVDIDRLMSTDGIVTSFNDGANNSWREVGQPTRDSDNFGSE